jgi:hypothetical protein
MTAWQVAEKASNVNAECRTQNADWAVFEGLE